MDTCILCKSSKKDDVLYGEFLKNKNMAVHTFCLYLSSNLSQNGNDDEGFLGFLEKDIRKEERRISLLKCFYCHKHYANIGCCESRCRRSFHLICGLENYCENQFCHEFRSYCHSHIRKVQQHPATTETCFICYEKVCVGSKRSQATNAIQAPCCRNGWFHKLCLLKFAKTSGYFFKCPLCNDSKVFREKLPAKGIYIPNQDAAWELEPNAFAELLERPSVCAATKCKNKQGRKFNNDSNPFIMCSTCGSTAMHRLCLSNGVKQFNCSDCSIAIEEDSGRESFNSQVNQRSENTEDEVVDVCNVSDNEDLALITGLIERQTNEETQMNKNNEQKLKQNKSYKTYNERAGHSNAIYWDSSSEEEEEKCLELGVNSSSSHKTYKPCNKNSSTSEDSDTIRPCTKKPIIVISDSEDEKVLTETNSLNVKESKARPRCSQKIKKSISFDHDTADSDAVDVISSENNSMLTDESDDDDPLENFTKIIEQQKNISCIALRTRRKSQNNEKSQDLTTNSEDLKISIVPEEIKTPANVTSSRRKTECFKQPPDLNKNKTDSDNKCTTNNSQSFKNATKYNVLDVSCIAKRTRRRTMDCMRNNNSKKENQNETSTSTSDSLNVSCIAKRTRHKSLYIPKVDNGFNERSPTLVTFHKSTEDIRDKSELDCYHIPDDDSEPMVYCSSHENEGDVHAPNDSEENNIIFELSCIGNRTRKRKSLKYRMSSVDDTTSITISSTSSTSKISLSSLSSHSSSSHSSRSSHSSSSDSSLSLPSSSSSHSSSSNSASSHSLSSHSSSSSTHSSHKVNFKKRRCLRTSSSEDSESGNSINSDKRKTISSCLYLERLPQNNPYVYLTQKYVSKSSASSSNIYYPKNHYHPHGNNRRRV